MGVFFIPSYGLSGERGPPSATAANFEGRGGGTRTTIYSWQKQDYGVLYLLVPIFFLQGIIFSINARNSRQVFELFSSRTIILGESNVGTNQSFQEYISLELSSSDGEEGDGGGGGGRLELVHSAANGSDVVELPAK